MKTVRILTSWKPVPVNFFRQKRRLTTWDDFKNWVVFTKKLSENCPKLSKQPHPEATLLFSKLTTSFNAGWIFSPCVSLLKKDEHKHYPMSNQGHGRCNKISGHRVGYSSILDPKHHFLTNPHICVARKPNIIVERKINTHLNTFVYNPKHHSSSFFFLNNILPILPTKRSQTRTPNHCQRLRSWPHRSFRAFTRTSTTWGELRGPSEKAS